MSAQPSPVSVDQLTNVTLNVSDPAASQEFLNNLDTMLSGENVVIPPAAFDNIMSNLGTAVTSTTSQSQTMNMLTGLMSGLAASGSQAINPDRALAVVGILADVKPSAETLAGAGDLLRTMSEALTGSLPVGTPLLLGDPASGFAMAVLKVDPAAPAQITLGSGSSLDVPPLAEILGGGVSAPLHFAASTSSTGTPVYSIGLSQGGQEVTVRNLTTPFVMAFPPGPAPNATQQVECVYYDPTSKKWLADGCHTTFNNVTNTTSCACDHLTEFGTRFSSLLAVQEGVGQGFVDLFSGNLSPKMIPIAIFLGTMLGTTILFVFCLNGLDKTAIAKYSKMLELIPQLQQIRESVGITRKESWDRFLSSGFLSLPKGVQARKVLADAEVPKGTFALLRIWWLRLLPQHFYTSLLVRYDPRVPRVLRLLFVCVSFFTSVAVVIFFYGYRYGVPGQSLPEITLAETIVLSLLSSALTTPLITILRMLMTKAGEWEFKVRYPQLAAEIDRRKLFERAIRYLPIDTIIKEGRKLLGRLHLLSAHNDNSDKGSGSDSDSSRKGGRTNVRPPAAAIAGGKELSLRDLGTSGNQEVGQNAASVIVALSDGSSANLGDEAVEAIELNFIFAALTWLASHITCSKCCRKQAAKQAKTLSLRKLILYVMRKSKIPSINEKPCLPYKFFPVHTGKSWLLVSGLLVWLVFTMIYILAFTSYQSEGTAEGVIRAVATSQAISNGVVAPITSFTSILLPYLIALAKKRFKKSKPLPLSIGFPLSERLDKLLATRLPVLSSLHPCGTGKKYIDVKLMPIQEIISTLVNQDKPNLSEEARNIIEEIYYEVFHNKGVEKSVWKKGKKSDKSSSNESTPKQTPNISPHLGPQPMNELVIQDITDVANLQL